MGNNSSLSAVRGDDYSYSGRENSPEFIQNLTTSTVQECRGRDFRIAHYRHSPTHYTIVPDKQTICNRREEHF